MKSLVIISGALFLIIVAIFIIWLVLYTEDAISIRLGKEILTINTKKFVYVVPRSRIKSISHSPSGKRWYIESEADSLVFIVKDEVFNKNEAIEWLNI